MKPCPYCQDGQPANCECTPETDDALNSMLIRVGFPIVGADFARALERDRNKWRAMAEELVIIATLSQTTEVNYVSYHRRVRNALEKFNQLKNQ